MNTKTNEGIILGVVYTSSEDFTVDNIPSDLNDICKAYDARPYFTYVCNKEYNKEAILITTKELKENEANSEFHDILVSTYGE